MNIHEGRVNIDLSCGRKTVRLLISWLHERPADLDLDCFKTGNRMQKKLCT